VDEGTLAQDDVKRRWPTTGASRCRGENPQGCKAGKLRVNQPLSAGVVRSHLAVHEELVNITREFAQANDSAIAFFPRTHHA
jgi:hypothetical protein